MSIIIGNPIILPIEGVTVEPLSVTENSTYTAPEGNAYNPVTVNVPEDPTTVEPLSVVANGTYTAPAGKAYSPVTVDVPSSGGADKNNVNFHDYDGTVVQSYTAEEFMALTAMPANPTHPRLTALGWNWTLADAKAYVASYGKLEIGQMYATSDGKTRLYIHLEDGRVAPYLGFAINGTATVDWGDGSTSTVTGTSIRSLINTRHTYAAAGDYIIAIEVSGSMALMGDDSYRSRVLWDRYTGNIALDYNRVYRKALRKVEIGANTNIDDYAFYSCDYLTSITIPSSITSISDYAFVGCSSLVSITIPSGVTDLGAYAFSGCSSLVSITIPSSVTSIGGYTFRNCSSLTSITIPNSVTSIDGYMFQGCYSLTSITIPSSITSIGPFAFDGCTSLASITIPSSVTSIGYNAFKDCHSLISITIPSGVTSFGSAIFTGSGLVSITISDGITSISNSMFSSCYSLTSITIPDSVTSIGDSAFYGCATLPSITIPSGVTSIGNLAFQNCFGLGYIKFEATTPPTVSDIKTWYYIPTDCVIYVPSGTLSAYKSAANYPSGNTYAEY